MKDFCIIFTSSSYKPKRVVIAVVTQVGSRQTATQQEVFGAFKGAGVVRGQDWSWDNQDGGLGAVGRVLALADWNSQTARSVLTVLWPNKGENMYRLGHKVGTELCSNYEYR